ncbi:MAG: hypothetical protein V4543_05795 [Bacteroidota bacterium]
MHIENATISLSPEIWNLIREVPARELESALQKAFPEYFMKTNAIAGNKQDMAILDYIHNLDVSNPQMDTDEALRQLREEDF